jgi:hypothetical protein
LPKRAGLSQTQRPSPFAEELSERDRERERKIAPKGNCRKKEKKSSRALSLLGSFLFFLLSFLQQIVYKVVAINARVKE